MHGRPLTSGGINLIFKEFSVDSKSLGSLNRNLSPFEQNVIDFAREWLSDQQVFEFQTSGSTGTPQKIKFNRSAIVASAHLTQQTFQLRKNQKALLGLDPGFIAGKMMIVRALEIGMDLYCIPPTANPLEALSDNLTLDFAALVPYQVNAILNSADGMERLSKIKQVIVGGSPVPDSWEEKLRLHPTQYYETYGMTETLTHIAIRKLNPWEKAFRALPGIKIFLDERQCLNIQPSHLETEIIRTNDIAALSDAGAFRLIGRYDNIINTGGAKVSPEDVERKIAAIMVNKMGGCDYFVSGIKDETFGERVVLFVEGEDIDANLKQFLIEHLRLILNKWEVPREIVALPAFMRTDSGKVNRKESVHHLSMGS